MLLQSLPSSSNFDLSDLSVASLHSHQVARNSSHFYSSFWGGLNQDHVYASLASWPHLKEFSFILGTAVDILLFVE